MKNNVRLVMVAWVLISQCCLADNKNVQSPTWNASVASKQSPKDIHYNSLWQRLRSGFSLTDYNYPLVKRQLNWYQKHPFYLQQIINRTSLYLYTVTQQVEAEKLPLELALLPIIESNYNPFAKSKDNATGLWQFMPKTARRFRLNTDAWYDAKRDVNASTQAALTYLQKLYKRFGNDWLLAIAAYNAGEGKVGKARYRNQKKGLPMDFLSIRLPGETRIYVARLLALAKIIKQPKQYKLRLKDLPNTPYYRTVTMEQQIDLPLVSLLTGINTIDLYQLNPAMVAWVTPPEGPHNINIPTSHLQQFQTGIKALKQQDWVQWNPYIVQAGETLLSIANAHNTTPRTLRLINRIRGNSLFLGQHLLVPQ